MTLWKQPYTNSLHPTIKQKKSLSWCCNSIAYLKNVSCINNYAQKKTVGRNSKRQMYRFPVGRAGHEENERIFAVLHVTPMPSTTGQQHHSSFGLFLIVLKMYCYCSSCPVRNFTGLRCKLNYVTSLLHWTTDLDHMSTVKTIMCLLPNMALSVRDIRPPHCVILMQSS
ncbi:Myosin-XV-like protein [Daphnia magna]|uniref:Myosin-XV-like protein n=1 Tax=Daphnia magna TaxID=35525 RepID=A0A164MB89_9CRUS|nr:Myosin-XV-like protein [Daphnia magna]